MTAAEEWRRVPTDPDYEASSLGRIRSWKRSAGRVLVQKPNTSGYLTVRIVVNGKNRITAVHRLVALAFYGPRPDGMVTRHLDGDRVNNLPSNLQYGEQSENELDKVRHGTHPQARKTHCVNGHEFTPENTRRRRPNRPWRSCLACELTRNRAAKARAKATSNSARAAA